MSHVDIVDKTIVFVKERLSNFKEGGHDYFHVERVYKNALLIAKGISCDATVVQLGALLHDIADSKFHDGDGAVGPKIARLFLESENVSESIITQVVNIIKNISYKGRDFEKIFTSVELDIVQDADRLDAIGAIGIARAFNYGGFRNRSIYNPNINPNINMATEEYKKSTAPTINHFYEKLLLLRDKMNTEPGKQIADQRHQFIEFFLLQFYAEWAGEK